MSVEKEFLKERGIESRISFKETPKVQGIKILKRKSDIITGRDGEEVHGIKYLVEHEGEQKTFFTSSISLVAKLINYKDDDIVDIEAQSFKTPQGYRVKYLVSGGQQGQPGEASEDSDEPEPEPDSSDIDPEEIPF